MKRKRTIGRQTVSNYELIAAKLIPIILHKLDQRYVCISGDDIKALEKSETKLVVKDSEKGFELSLMDAGEVEALKQGDDPDLHEGEIGQPT